MPIELVVTIEPLVCQVFIFFIKYLESCLGFGFDFDFDFDFGFDFLYRFKTEIHISLLGAKKKKILWLVTRNHGLIKL